MAGEGRERRLEAQEGLAQPGFTTEGWGHIRRLWRPGLEHGNLWGSHSTPNRQSEKKNSARWRKEEQWLRAGQS